MLFNSFTFWLFYLLVFIVYWKLQHKSQNNLLLIASYVFYAAWDWRFLFLILTSTLIDFILGRAIYLTKENQKRKLLLAMSVTANLSILGFFKYYNFFSTELNTLFIALGIPNMLPTLDIILPVGISFYTFQTMSYSIDIYRSETKPIKSLRDYALYVSFFPQLVAGPIERSSRLIPQVISKRQWKNDYFLEGFYLVVYGLFLKIVIADNMASIVNTIFSKDTATLSGLEVLLGVYAFAFQIYGDFAGYSSIARGIAKWLGFDLMVNFRMPYLASNPSDFWRRWHISLSTWFRDYVYIPLGGNRHGDARSHLNLFVTMFLSGLWHGAAWTFIFWGMLHGAYLSIYNILKKRFGFTAIEDGKYRRLKHILSVVLMFNLVGLGWLFFRASDMSQAFDFLGLIYSSFHMTTFALGIIVMLLFYIFPLFLYELWTEKKGLMAITKISTLKQFLFYAYLIFMLLIFPSPTAHEFIYFQF